MVVKRSDPEKFPSQIAFTKPLNKGRKSLDHKNKTYDLQHDYSISQKCQNRQSRAQSKCPGVSHEKSSGVNIKPQKCQKGANDSAGKSGNPDFALHQINSHHCRKAGGERAAGKTIKTVSNVHRIGQKN